MFIAYKARINKNSITWIDDIPEEMTKNDSYRAYVTILKMKKKI